MIDTTEAYYIFSTLAIVWIVFLTIRKTIVKNDEEIMNAFERRMNKRLYGQYQVLCSKHIDQKKLGLVAFVSEDRCAVCGSNRTSVNRGDSNAKK